jgi:hypothetical protein
VAVRAELLRRLKNSPTIFSTGNTIHREHGKMNFNASGTQRAGSFEMRRWQTAGLRRTPKTPRAIAGAAQAPIFSSVDSLPLINP